MVTEYPFVNVVTFRGRCRIAVTLVEVLVVVAIIALLAGFLLPAVQRARESSHRSHCLSNLRQVGIGLQGHHEAKRHLPAAIIWAPAGEPLGGSIAPPGTIDRVSLGLAPQQEPDRMFANWMIQILPYLEEGALYDAFDSRLPIGDPRNELVRATDIPFLKCPSDAYNGADNHFQRAGRAATDRGYARGNYAMNAGSNARCLMELSKAWPPGTCTDGFHVNGTNLETDTTQVWGSGIGGVNRWFGYREFPNGLSNTVAIEEIRAGVHALDRRGVWSLGFPGCSVTVAHGITGNRGPNAGADSIQGCAALTAELPDLGGLGMPCSGNPQMEICEQATSRSMHSGGVNLGMADGSAHFVSDAVDPNVWHQMHKRDNQTSFKLPF